MSKEDELCDVCANHITPEHGGILCKNCNSLFCCSEKCISQKYLKKGVGYSQVVDVCPLCSSESDLAEKLEKEGYKSEDLDELVHAISSLEASAINNRGIPAQIGFLLTRSKMSRKNILDYLEWRCK